MRLSHFCRLWLATVLAYSPLVFSAPGDILFTDNFESGLAKWTVNNAGGGSSAIGTQTAGSPTRSLYTRWNIVTATTISINANVSAAQLSLWIRRGADAFSEDTDAGDDLVLEYLNNNATWVTLETFLGSGTTGEILTPIYNLPAPARYNGLQLRVRQTGGSGNDYDYWHIDDVIVTEIAPLPPIAVGTCDNFESGFSNWTVSSAGGDAGISTQTFNSASNAMFTRWGDVTVSSNIVNFSSASEATITMWVRVGADTFSEDPDPGEDLIVSYLDNTYTWQVLETFLGSATDGTIYTRTYVLPANALHADFRLRFRQTAGNGSDWDYFHVDDVCFLDTSPTPSTYYNMNETSWPAANTVLDTSGNNNHGSPIGGVNTATATPAIAGSPGTCAYGNIPQNTSDATFDAINTTTTPGNRGSATFWYRSNAAWNVADQMLLDASTDLGNSNADKYFFLVKRSNGRLHFRIEDSGDTDSAAETGNLGFAANTWVHIAITWDLPNDLLEIYVDGSLSASSAINVNGTAGAWQSLYIGDNRQANIGSNNHSPNSANGLIDEFRLYTTRISQTVVQADRARTHSCSSLNHFAITHDGNAVTCQAENITIAAHQSSHSILTSYTGVLNLSTSTARGDWSVITGSGTLVNGTVNDGIATYTMVSADNGQVILGLKDTTAETININVNSGGITETSGNTMASEDQNLVFAATGFNFLANSAANNIGIQIAGKASNVAPGSQTLELQAIRTSDSTGACEAALVGNNNIELAFECNNPATCTARQVAINATNIAGNNQSSVSTYTNVSLDFGDATDTTATFTLNYPDTGQLRLHARYTIPLGSGGSSGTNMQGASNLFVSRPFAYHTTVTGNPAASSSTGAVFTRAGTNFTVTTRGVLWEAADDTNNDGIADNHNDTNPANNSNLSNNTVALNYGRETPIESIQHLAVLDQPAAGTNPGVSGTTIISGFTNGSGSTANINYPEVGIIEIGATVSDSNYLSIGAIETAKIIGKSGYVGRFIPNHFALSSGVFVNRVNETCAPASTFTYMGEPFRLEFTLTAQNTSNATTQNYAGAFAKLNPATIASMNIGAIDTTIPTPLTSRISNGTSSGSWSNGVANIFASASLNRNATPDGPYNNFSVGVNATDSDNVQTSGFNLDIDNNAVNDRRLVGSSSIRFGRMVLQNNFGSELLAVPIPLFTEYYSGTQFILNTNDNCTAYNHSNISFSNRLGLTADPSKIGSGLLITGNVDSLTPIRLNSSGQSGSIDATLIVPVWLQFDWDNNGTHDNNPSSHINFGIFKGSDKQIYIREVY